MRPDDHAPDALDEMIEEYSAHNPKFPALLAAAERRRTLLHALADVRRSQSASQTSVAANMGTSQSGLARLETAADDALLSTVDRFAAALGFRVEHTLVPIDTPSPTRT